MSVKTGVRNFFCFLLGLVGLIVSVLGVMGVVKGEGATYIIISVVGAGLFVLGVFLSKANNPKTKKIVIGFFAGIMALVVIIGLATPTDEQKRQREIENAEKWKEKDNHVMAHVHLQQYVKKELISPSTAKFPTTGYDYKIQDEHTYIINSWVDSQNALGATIRTKFTGTIQQVDSDRWRLIELTFE